MKAEVRGRAMKEREIVLFFLYDNNSSFRRLCLEFLRGTNKVLMEMEK